MQKSRAVCSCASGCCSRQSTRSNSGQSSSRTKWSRKCQFARRRTRNLGPNASQSSSCPRSNRGPSVEALRQRDQNHPRSAQIGRHSGIGDCSTLPHRTINPLPGSQACCLTDKCWLHVYAATAATLCRHWRPHAAKLSRTRFAQIRQGGERRKSKLLKTPDFAGTEANTCALSTGS